MPRLFPIDILAITITRHGLIVSFVKLCRFGCIPLCQAKLRLDVLQLANAMRHINFENTKLCAHLSKHTSFVSNRSPCHTSAPLLSADAIRGLSKADASNICGRICVARLHYSFCGPAVRTALLVVLPSGTDKVLTKLDAMNLGELSIHHRLRVEMLKNWPTDGSHHTLHSTMVGVTAQTRRRFFNLRCIGRSLTSILVKVQFSPQAP
mmetsp:Transcript_59577/g.141764  ORF Transcript_59577/g.141764 Transcript_59577/m.141764 type:complete len:208 (-) Transcript_59577:133-756(-)